MQRKTIWFEVHVIGAHQIKAVHYVEVDASLVNPASRAAAMEREKGYTVTKVERWSK